MKQNSKSRIRVLVVGAGKAGELIVNNLEKNTHSGFKVVGFVDDDKTKIGKIIAGFEVFGGISQLREIVVRERAEEILIAIPSGRGETIRNIINETAGLKIGYKILPRHSEVLRQDFGMDYLKYIRNVLPEDMLGGQILKSDQDNVAKNLKEEVVLITGAAGSIGSELSRQIVSYGAKKVVLFDWWENGIFELRNQLNELYPEAKVEFVIGDVKNRERIDFVISHFNPSTVFHAAAYKHVPLMEENPSEAIKNNILGTKNVAEISIKNGVKKFVLISTDKAVNPTNVMGATKRAAEKLVHILSSSQTTTKLCAVRFGNVINSNGSAIPYFEKQIARGGPVTVTHKEITRFFMTIPEAVHLILQAWVMGENNDLFVLDMGESVKIYDLARLLIALHGYVPEEEIEIKIIGLRPGEKLYEEVLVKEEEVKATTIEKVFKTKNYHNFNELAFIHKLELLAKEVENSTAEPKQLRQRLRSMVSTYVPSS